MKTEVEWKSVKQHPQNAEELALLRDRPTLLLWSPKYGIQIGVVWHWKDGECTTNAQGHLNCWFPYYAEIKTPEDLS